MAAKIALIQNQTQTITNLRINIYMHTYRIGDFVILWLSNTSTHSDWNNNGLFYPLDHLCTYSSEGML